MTSFIPVENETVESQNEDLDDAAIFLNRIEKENQNHSFEKKSVGIFETILTRLERLAIILKHDKFDEIEAAAFLRLPDPEHRGAETIRYHALRSRKLSFHRIGKSGLIFTKMDLEKALKNFKFESHRDL